MPSVIQNLHIITALHNLASNVIDTEITHANREERRVYTDTEAP